MYPRTGSWLLISPNLVIPDPANHAARLAQEEWNMRASSCYMAHPRNSRLLVTALTVLLSLCAPETQKAEERIQVRASRTSPLVDFAVAELKAALKEVEHPPRVVLELKGGEPESFSIRKTGDTITVEGGDGKGLMYGALELAEKLTLAKTADAIQNESQEPFLPIRALKFNIPLAGTMYLSEEDLQHNQWFWDLEYWQAFLDMAARNRYNSISFWSAHPYDRMVRIAKYAEATALPAAELDRNIAFFGKLFRMARERGIDAYLITWNIHNSPAFAKAHNIPEHGFDSELVRDYQRECIKALLETYPDLIGLGTTQGERMDAIPEDKRAEWISDVYFRAIRESGRREVPFVLRYWGGTPAATEQAAAAYDRGPMYLDIKYNGEHMYSSTRDHVEDPAWLKPSRHYKLLWHLRNDDIYIFRWGNPRWVSELIRNLGKTDTVGFTEGSEIDIPGVDRIHTPEARPHVTWKYKFEKMWFRFALWGRLGYNPALSEDVWNGHFARRFGGAGDAMYRATVAAGEIAPTITAYHWNYMNGDWYPEGSIGSWNTAYEQPRINYRRNEMFHHIDTYVFNTTIDSTLEDPLSYVARTLAGGAAPEGARSPLDIAAQLEQAGRTALDSGRRPEFGGSGEYVCADLDNQAYGRLGLYYAEKLRGAVALARYLFTGQAAYKSQADSALREALVQWKELATVTRSHYVTHEVWLFGRFNWDMYTPAVERDIEIAEQAKPFERSTQHWQVAADDASPAAWKDFESTVFSSFDRAGLHEWVIYFNTQYNSARVRKALGGSPSVVSWKAKVQAPPGRRLVVEIAGDPAAKVTSGGKTLAASSPEVGRSVRVFDASKGGEVTVTASPGAVPFLGVVAAGKQAVLASGAAAVERIQAPLEKTPAGTLIIPASFKPPEGRIGISDELEEPGTAIYAFRVAQPGFYRFSCQVRTEDAARHVFSYTIDNWNGQGHSIDGASQGAWRLVSAPHAVALGAGEHTLRLKFYRPGIELKEVRVVAVSPSGR